MKIQYAVKNTRMENMNIDKKKHVQHYLDIPCDYITAKYIFYSNLCMDEMTEQL